MSLIIDFKSAVKKLPLVRAIVLERDKLHSELVALKKTLRFVPPGHFYSPIPSLEEVLRDEPKIFGSIPLDIPGIDLRESNQLRLLETFVQFYADMPFQPQKIAGLRYYFENPAYSYSDGIILHCMIRTLMPKKIIEVGSGFSSCMTLDTNEICFENTIATTFIEPFPALLHSLLKETDKDECNTKIISRRLQDIDIAEFEALGPNDILFLDSSHVSKINSDVNRVFFEILPRLVPGVYVHFHDVFYPFEYPKEWIIEGRAWNELYMLRAFLQYNKAFEVIMMNTYMEHIHESFFRENMPLCLKNPGGSIWIRKISN